MPWFRRWVPKPVMTVWQRYYAVQFMAQMYPGWGEEDIAAETDDILQELVVTHYPGGWEGFVQAAEYEAMLQEEDA